MSPQVGGGSKPMHSIGVFLRPHLPHSDQLPAQSPSREQRALQSHSWVYRADPFSRQEQLHSPSSSHRSGQTSQASIVTMGSLLQVSQVGQIPIASHSPMLHWLPFQSLVALDWGARLCSLAASLVWVWEQRDGTPSYSAVILEPPTFAF